MKLTFEYDKEKDIWCLFNKGKSSNNSPTPTKVFGQIMDQYGENPTEQEISEFIDTYIKEKKISVKKYCDLFSKDWDIVDKEFQKRSEKIFGVRLPENITAYLTLNNRCPYSFEEDYFYVSIQGTTARKIAMHELLHFYTWYWVGKNEGIQAMGAQKFNDLKESLTVLLNIEFKDLFPEGSEDIGYPQHKELREKIIEFWETNKNISDLWEYLKTQ